MAQHVGRDVGELSASAGALEGRAERLVRFPVPAREDPLLAVPGVLTELANVARSAALSGMVRGRPDFA